MTCGIRIQSSLLITFLLCSSVSSTSGSLESLTSSSCGWSSLEWLLTSGDSLAEAARRAADSMAMMWLRAVDILRQCLRGTRVEVGLRIVAVGLALSSANTHEKESGKPLRYVLELQRSGLAVYTSGEVGGAQAISERKHGEKMGNMIQLDDPGTWNWGRNARFRQSPPLR